MISKFEAESQKLRLEGDRFITARAVGALIGRSAHTVVQYSKRGILPPYHTIGGVHCFKASQLKPFMANLNTANMRLKELRNAEVLKQFEKQNKEELLKLCEGDFVPGEND